MAVIEEHASRESDLVEPTKAELAETNRFLIDTFARKYNLPPQGTVSILSKTAFRLDKEGTAPTFEQIVALIVVCNVYGLNPFTKEIFAFPDKHKGVIPVVSVDGWLRIINERPELDGFEFRYSDDVYDVDSYGVLKGLTHKTHLWIECVIYRKDRTCPIVAREYLEECYRPPGQYGNGPWQTHTNRFLRHKALIQCARMAFGFAGIYDDDEAQRILRDSAEDETGTVPPPVVEMPTRKPVVDAPVDSLRAFAEEVERLKTRGLKIDHETGEITSTSIQQVERGIDAMQAEAGKAAATPPPAPVPGVPDSPASPPPAPVAATSPAPNSTSASGAIPAAKLSYLRMRMEFNGVSDERLAQEFEGGVDGLKSMADFVKVANWVEEFDEAES